MIGSAGRRKEQRKRKDNAETQSAQSLAEKEDGRARTASMFASGTAIQICSLRAKKLLT